MKQQFKDKGVLITGGSSGIGRATALAFANAGANVVVADVNESGGKETVQLIEEIGGAATFVRCDVTQADQVEAMVDTVMDTYGRLDFAHNNAGVEGESTPIADTTEQEWDRTIGINLKGVFLCMKYEIPRMVEQGGGVIINMSSIAGLGGVPGLVPYTASKHGVIGITKTAALEYGPVGIRANAICPGAIRTPMIDRFIASQPEMEQSFGASIPLGRIGEPEDVANLVLSLCADTSSYITGQAIAIDGGGRAA